ncbi:uncharacterized protein EV422DRAFT_81049 [Fimicolochytrium jonesii]|uniref:uncharacterized protein n=1 Tax=Fimicolochytrium jonesii TaxID=1396493 RepID=UPI0022FF277C|nr:uncharacterized protein EV422DRAFT_81049 [Fimicolochytrium jonesii]KAI8820158.1 hypothetical protein EV422DRAFT_81049 [Fimicolochytrium jonesii]
MSNYTDLEKGRPQNNPAWEKQQLTLTLLGEDISALILEKKHATRAGLDTSEQDGKIKRHLATMKDGIGRLEQSLSEAEDAGGRDVTELRRWEESVLQLSQTHDRLDVMSRGEDGAHLLAKKELLARPSSGNSAKGKTVRFTEPFDGTESNDGIEMDAGSSLQLHQRIMDDQDNQLDELAETIGRQKQIGLMINDELDLHVDLLEETETRVDNTHRRLQGAGRRLEQVLLSGSRNSKGNTLICILVGILILVIVIAKKF